MTHDWPAAGDLLARRYRLVALLESGGMADIWRAEDELLERPVALKLPTDTTATSAEALHLAWKEARLAARPAHPGIAVVHDYNGAVRPDRSVAPFVVMELLTGETLAARVERAPLSWREAARLGTAVAEALAAAHASGVVHRDIKPGNVMLTPTGVKILDFGISAITGEPDDDETGATFGTPAYVAPERLDGKPAEPATDVYGLGVLLYEMVAGQPPYPVDTWEELEQARRTRRPELPPDLPAGFRKLVADCLGDEPGLRPTAEEAADRLALLGAEPPPPRHAARRRLAVPVGIAAAVATVAAIVLVTRPADGPRTSGAAPPPPSPAASSARPAPSPSTVVVELPPAPPPVVRRTTPAPPPRLDFDDAVARMRSAVETGRDRRQIRADVAVDLLNLLDTLDGAEPAGVDARLADLRRKLRSRAEEGSVAPARADVLEARLADVDRAAGS
ncbi:serine/threonine protein kinase [Couchioplanes caeruleus]|uniref:serine/threonine-protein kinase n=1 Tax=Couchioplanes caeruleus TaxID=56438 RepID=UPI0020BDC1E7|nr:serine/threonine-protein kinase [Couchioplanes caeruleus]UQU67917.1 serine/threonine protein kinase [Couchioplanes caeruleus]